VALPDTAYATRFQPSSPTGGRAAFFLDIQLLYIETSQRSGAALARYSLEEHLDLLAIQWLDLPLLGVGSLHGRCGK